jgi:hypothetical protein
VKESVRFTKEQKLYLEKLFNDGEMDKTKRARVDAVEKDMILRFDTGLVLNESQITSYFSRLCSLRKKQNHQENEMPIDENQKEDAAAPVKKKLDFKKSRN